MGEQISRLLWWVVYQISKPPIDQHPWWLAPTFSALLGAVVGFLSGLLGPLFVNDFIGRRNIRRLLYVDLATMFWRVDCFSKVDPSTFGASNDPLSWQQEQLRKTLDFGVEKHCQNIPQFYFQLPERFAGQTLYQGFHRLLDDPARALNLNVRSVMQKFVGYVRSEKLEKKRFTNSSARKRQTTCCFSLMNISNSTNR